MYKLEVKYWFWLATIILLLIVPTLLRFTGDIHNNSWVNIEIHTGIESAGSILSLLIASVIYIIFKDQKYDVDFIIIGIAFLGMGIFDFYHSTLDQGQAFVWSHIISVFSGGFWFSMLVLPEHYKHKLIHKKYVYLCISIWIIILLFLIFYNNHLPILIDSNGDFTFTADIINTLAGIGFLLGVYHLLKRFTDEKENEIFLLAIIGLLQGFSRITFHWSAIWSPDWWIWHIYRFLGSALIFGVITSLFRKMLLELKHTNLNQQTIIDAMPFGLYLVNKDKKIIRINEAAQQLSGYTESEVVHKYCFETLCGADCSNCPYIDKNEPIINKKLYVRSKDGVNIPVIKTVTEIEIDNEAVLLEGFVDVSEIEQAQSETKKTLEKLKRTNEELRQFNFVASHDLQEPLRKITNYADLLIAQSDNQLSDKSKGFIEKMKASTIRMQSLIENLLSLSRLSNESKVVSVNLAETFAELKDGMKQILMESNTLISWKNPPVISADYHQIKLLLFHLITNSIKFKSSHSPKINITSTETGSEWIIKFSDNGIGFEQQYAEKIFVAFQRLHHRGAYAGNGIGLAICRKIVENHGGTIKAISELGKGSEFIITLKKQ